MGDEFLHGDVTEVSSSIFERDYAAYGDNESAREIIILRTSTFPIFFAYLCPYFSAYLLWT